jgi:uncharacterized protein (TIGR03118 family)
LGGAFCARPLGAAEGDHVCKARKGTIVKLFFREFMPAAIAALAFIGVSVAGVGDADAASATNAFVVTNLVTTQQDSNLRNAWGIAFSPGGGPFWISDNAAGVSTLYDGAGDIQSLVVKIPGRGGRRVGAPTGIVWNPAASFLVPGTQIPAVFIFATENGTLAAWAPTIADNTSAVTVPGCCANADFTGLTFGVNPSGAFLFAANAEAGRIDVFDNSYKRVKSAGGFVDRKIPTGFAPYNIQNIDGNLFVTYSNGGQGGFVDVFDTDGNLLTRLAGGNALSAPWGVARASFAFGPFSDDILIGNLGSGTIDAVTANGALEPLKGANGQPLFIDGLWALTLGGGLKSSPSTLYFTAGPGDYSGGAFGTITPAAGK